LGRSEFTLSDGEGPPAPVQSAVADIRGTCEGARDEVRAVEAEPGTVVMRAGGGGRRPLQA